MKPAFALLWFGKPEGEAREYSELGVPLNSPTQGQ